MKKLVLIGVLIVAVLAVGSFVMKGNQEEDDLIIGMSGGYKPYTFIDEEGNLTGFDVEVWKEIGVRMDKSIGFQTSEFSGLFGMLDTGKITTIANQITVTDQRQEKYDFSSPYVFYGAQLIVASDDEIITDLESLKGKKVGVSLGSNYEQIIRDFDTTNEIEVITYESYLGSLQDVAVGRIDAVLNDRLAGLGMINESGLDIKFGGEPVEMLYNAFPFVKSEENSKLLVEVNMAIEEMRVDGTLEEISKKWFDVNITE